MRTSTEKLAALLVAAGRQDRLAFSEFYALTSSRVYGMICDVTKGPDHDDVMQGVFVLAWQRAREYDPAKEGAMEWVMALAHRHAVDHARKGTALRVAGSGLVPHVVAEWEDTGSMRSLRSDERESIMMAYSAGMTYQSVAESLGVTEETVRGRIRNGMRNLSHSHATEQRDEH